MPYAHMAPADHWPPSEPFNDDGTWRQDVFFNTLNTTYVEIALRAARAADPAAKLYINDYNIEQSGPKATAMLNLVKQLLAADVPLDGVGFQSHFIVGAVPTSFQTVLEQFTALGLEVAITELDIRTSTPASAAALAQQERDFQTVVQTCMNVEGCVGVTIWDFSDKYSWVPSTFSGQGAACPWDQVSRCCFAVYTIDRCSRCLLPEPCQKARIQRHCGCSYRMKDLEPEVPCDFPKTRRRCTIVDAYLFSAFPL